MNLEQFAQDIPIKDIIKESKEVEMNYNEIIGMSIGKTSDEFIDYINGIGYEEYMKAVNYFYLMRNLVDLKIKDV